MSLSHCTHASHISLFHINSITLLHNILSQSHPASSSPNTPTSGTVSTPNNVVVRIYHIYILDLQCSCSCSEALPGHFLCSLHLPSNYHLVIHFVPHHLHSHPQSHSLNPSAPLHFHQFAPHHTVFSTSLSAPLWWSRTAPSPSLSTVICEWKWTGLREGPSIIKAPS